MIGTRKDSGMTFSRIALAFLICTCLATPALADPPAQKPPAAAHGKGKAADGRAQWRLARLRRAGVDDNRARRALATIERFDAERRKLQEQARTHRVALNKLVSTNAKDEQSFARELAASRSAEKKLFDLRARQTDALLRILKPSELARFQAAGHGPGQGKAKKNARGRKAGGKKKKKR